MIDKELGYGLSAEYAPQPPGIRPNLQPGFAGIGEHFGENGFVKQQITFADRVNDIVVGFRNTLKILFGVTEKPIGKIGNAKVRHQRKLVN
jgi:hypothetical protein